MSKARAVVGHARHEVDAEFRALSLPRAELLAKRDSAGARQPSGKNIMLNVSDDVTVTVVPAISIAGSHERMDGGDDVECEPGARHDDCCSMIVWRKGVSPDFGLIGFGDITAVLNRSRYGLSPPWLTGAFYDQR